MEFLAWTSRFTFIYIHAKPVYYGNSRKIVLDDTNISVVNISLSITAIFPRPMRYPVRNAIISPIRRWSWIFEKQILVCQSAIMSEISYHKWLTLVNRCLRQVFWRGSCDPPSKLCCRRTESCRRVCTMFGLCMNYTNILIESTFLDSLVLIGYLSELAYRNVKRNYRRGDERKVTTGDVIISKTTCTTVTFCNWVGHPQDAIPLQSRLRLLITRPSDFTSTVLRVSQQPAVTLN